MELLKEIKIAARKPDAPGKYLIKFFGGTMKLKNWLTRLNGFSKVPMHTSIESWYKEVSIPEETDVHFVVNDMIPPTAHPRERELILQGARMASDFIMKTLRDA